MATRRGTSMKLQLPHRRHAKHPGVRRFAGYFVQTATVIAGVGLLATCASTPSLLGRIQRSGTLVFATPNSPTTYYLGAYGAAGPDYELARRFAHELGVRLEVMQVPNGHQALEAVAAGRADIAAPGVSARSERLPGLRFTPPYQRVSSLLIYRDGEAVPSDAANLAAAEFKLTVAPGYAPLMRSLARAHPGIRWQAPGDRGSDELLVGVAQNKIAYTVVNENEFNLNRRFYPRLRAAFPIGSPQPLAWAVRKDEDASLYQAAVAFFARAEADHTVADVLKRYYGERVAYDRSGTQLFLEDVGKRLPSYAVSFEQAGTATGFAWQLLAAIGYQESHWNAQAVSPTGVRGLMMLTAPTASDLGIRDRSDPHLSIIGAARYLSQLLARLPASIPQPDRAWMALASYNIGYGHLMDARRITAREGGNPDRWVDVKQRLPLLGEQRYYSHTRYGYANGVGAARYVSNIRGYYDILSWRTAQNSLPAQLTGPLKTGAATSPAN